VDDIDIDDIDIDIDIEDDIDVEDDGGRTTEDGGRSTSRRECEASRARARTTNGMMMMTSTIRGRTTTRTTRTRTNATRTTTRTNANTRARARTNAKAKDGVSDIAAMDALIDLMANAKTNEELTKIVAENVLSFDQKMWLRFASRSDAASTTEEKTRVMTLASKTMKLVETMVQKTESTIAESSKALQIIVGAAADPKSGEFDVPLKPDALQRMKSALEKTTVDERTLNTLYAWIRKSDENKLDGMVHILQRLLQLYAARELDEKSSPLDKVIRANAEDWTMNLIDIANEGYGESAFVKDLQRRMEGVVLNLPNGSYAQRVQAEYLKEIEDRGKQFFAKR